MLRKLTEKQKRFADEYLIDLNATAAAIRSGYSENTARSIASSLLTKVNVRAYIDERMAQKENKLIADQDEILKFLTSIMRGEVEEPMPLLDGDGYQKVVNVKPSAQSRKAAAELLGKRYAMWTDKKDITGDIGISISVDYGDGEE